MNSLFIPKPLREKDLTKTSSQFYFSQFEEALIYSVENTIYYTCGFDNPGTVLKDRAKPIGGLCFHEGALYDTAENRIFKNLSDEGLVKDNYIYDLCSHGKYLYDCGKYNTVNNTFEGFAIKDLGTTITHLVSHDYLYASSGSLVFRLPDGGVVADFSTKETFVCDMCAYEDLESSVSDLFIARGNYDSEFRTSGGSLIVSGKDPNESIAYRDSSRLRLVVIDGVLYDIANNGCVRDTLNVPSASYREKNVGYLNGGVKDAITIPKDFLEELLL